ncbi:MAG: hypothetical protein ACPGXK_06845 [Phycisphaerae bacterium]
MIKRADAERILRGARTTVLGLLLLMPCGCQLLVNGFVDELADEPVVTTPSVVLSREYVGTPSTRTRDWAEVEGASTDGTVLHAPLYFEDFFEDQGSEDGEFKWTLEDYFWVVEWPSRYMINGAFMPVSMIVIPPWQVTASDGHLSDQWPGQWHDATRWDHAVKTPVDVHHDDDEAAPDAASTTDGQAPEDSPSDAADVPESESTSTEE